MTRRAIRRVCIVGGASFIGGHFAELAVEFVRPARWHCPVRLPRWGRGWRGDMPEVRINTEGIRALGWKNERTMRQAPRASMESVLAESRDGWFGR
jgi:UDP-glucose 4-epimerase